MMIRYTEKLETNIKSELHEGTKGMFINTLVGGLENLVGGSKKFGCSKKGGQKSF